MIGLLEAVLTGIQIKKEHNVSFITTTSKLI